ncbi:hypothetical protein H1R20_g15569, partial [Candolleomyces eurysporus]
MAQQLFTENRVRGRFRRLKKTEFTPYCALNCGRLTLDEGAQKYEVALKTYRWNPNGATKAKAKERTFKEVMALSRLKAHPHRNVNTFRGVIFATVEEVGARVAPIDSVPSIVTDWVPFGSIEYTTRIKFQLRLDIIVQLASGLAHLHGLGVVHGDIKPNNFRITSSGVVKIIDLGLSRCQDPYPEDVGYTTTYPSFHFIAPELIVSKAGCERMAVTKPTDVYAWSMTALQILDGRGEQSLPFAGVSDSRDVMREVLQGRWPTPAEYPGVESQAAWGILKRCWTPEPTPRPTIQRTLRDLDAL